MNWSDNRINNGIFKDNNDKIVQKSIITTVISWVIIATYNISVHTINMISVTFIRIKTK